MTPAVVTLRVPNIKGEPITVALPLWCPAYTRQKAAGYVADDHLIGACLDEAKAAWDVGNPTAVVLAARVLQARPDWRWPTWLTTAVIATLEGRQSEKSQGGRHARAVTKWRGDAADYLRYRAVEILRRDGRRVPAVYEDVAERLPLEDGEHGDAKDEAIAKAYRRVIARTGAEPRRARPSDLRYHPRYFPDIATLHLLNAVDTIGMGKKPPVFLA